MVQILHMLNAVLESIDTVVLIEKSEHLGDDALDELVRMSRKRHLWEHQKRIRFLMCGNPEMKLISRLPKIWQVSQNTEYQECLKSLEFSELNFRRNQISQAATGTNEWLWKHPSYQAFKQQDSSILWIEGKAGSGKSVLAKCIQARLSSLRNASSIHSTQMKFQYNVGDWFYHGRRGAKYIAHDSLTRSVLYHMLQQSASLFVHFRDLYRALPAHGLFWDPENLWTILERICRAGEPAMIILDAVDEAEDTSVLILLRDLVALPQSRFKFIVLSRTNASIELRLHDTHHIRVEEENGGDISRYVDGRLEDIEKLMQKSDFELQTERALHQRGTQLRSLQVLATSTRPELSTAERRELEEIRKYLKIKARNTMLWVKVVMDDLQEEVKGSMYSFRSLREILFELPDEMTKYYRDMLKKLGCEGHNHKAKLVRRILMWVSGAGELRVITLEELWDALAIPEKSLMSSDDGDTIRRNRLPKSSFDELGRKLSNYCGPFIEIFPPQRDYGASPSHERHAMSTVQLMHQTVQDFLAKPEIAGPLYFHREEAVAMVERCAERYVEVILPTIPLVTVDASLEPFEQAEGHHEYTRSIADIVLWLDDRKLLSFVFTICAASDPDILNPFFCILEAEATEITDDIGENSLTIENEELQEGSMPVHNTAKLFQRACSEGLVGAVLNLTAIVAFFRPWWEYNREYIGSQIAQRQDKRGTVSLEIYKS